MLARAVLLALLSVAQGVRKSSQYDNVIGVPDQVTTQAQRDQSRDTIGMTTEVVDSEHMYVDPTTGRLVIIDPDLYDHHNSNFARRTPPTGRLLPGHRLGLLPARHAAQAGQVTASQSPQSPSQSFPQSPSSDEVRSPVAAPEGHPRSRWATPLVHLGPILVVLVNDTSGYHRQLDNFLHNTTLHNTLFAQPHSFSGCVECTSDRCALHVSYAHASDLARLGVLQGVSFFELWSGEAH